MDITVKWIHLVQNKDNESTKKRYTTGAWVINLVEGILANVVYLF